MAAYLIKDTQMANLDFLNGVDTSHSLLDHQATVFSEAKQIYKKYRRQGKRSVTGGLVGTSQLPTESELQDVTTTLDDVDSEEESSDSRLETIQHILNLSYNTIRSKFIEIYGLYIDPTDPESIETQEKYIRDRMIIIIVGHLLQDPHLSTLARSYMMVKYTNMNPALSDAEIATAFIDYNLKTDRDTQELLSEVDYEKEFFKELDNISTVACHRNWNGKFDDMYEWVYSSVYNNFLGERIDDDKKDAIRKVLQQIYPRTEIDLVELSDLDLIIHCVTNIFLDNIYNIIKTYKLGVTVDEIYGSVYSFVEHYYNNGASIESPDLEMKQRIIRKRYPKIIETELLIQKLASEIFFKFPEIKVVEA